MLRTNTHVAVLTLAAQLLTAVGLDGQHAARAQSQRDRDGLTAIIEGRSSKPLAEPPMKAGGPKPAEATPESAALGARMEKLTGVWIEGPGFEITYGRAYEACAERCLGNPSCVMVEYYFPEKKCNLYNTVRPRLKGGSSIVGIRK